IRMVLPDGTTTTLAGNGDAGHVDGTLGADGGAEFYGPEGVAVDSLGNVYVADSLNQCIRKFTPGSGRVSTIAGTGDGGYLDAPGASAKFTEPSGIAVDANGTLYVVDHGNNRIRMITQ